MKSKFFLVIATIATVAAAAVMPFAARAQVGTPVPPPNTTPTATAPAPKSDESKGGPQMDHREKLGELRKKHHDQRKALLDEMNAKMKEAKTPDEKRKLHDEFRQRIKDQNDAQKTEAMALRDSMGVSAEQLRDENMKVLEANRKAKSAIPAAAPKAPEATPTAK